MKIRHGVIISIALFIGIVVLGGDCVPINRELNEMIITIFLILWFVIVYLIIRNIFHAIKGKAAGGQSGDYTAEVRRVCEQVTPKKNKNATPPWEE